MLNVFDVVEICFNVGSEKSILPLYHFSTTLLFYSGENPELTLELIQKILTEAMDT